MISKKNRCIIITAWNESEIKACENLLPDDFIICADGGFDLAQAENITPDIIIGDMDSANSSSVFFSNDGEIPLMKAPAEKDDTDTMLCLKYGLSNGFRKFIIIGGLGGRLDHTFANLQVLSHFISVKTNFMKKASPNQKNWGSLWIADKYHRVTMIEGEELKLQGEKGDIVSLFSFTNECSGVNISGAKYPLQNATLSSAFPIGVSNEFQENEILISNKDGKLLIILATKPS